MLPLLRIHSNLTLYLADSLSQSNGKTKLGHWMLKLIEFQGLGQLSSQAV